MESADYYKILGVSENASQEEIRSAFIKLNLLHHPDRLKINEDSEVWQRANDYIKLINEAYSVLSNVITRENYDKSRSTNFSKQTGSSSNSSTGFKAREKNFNIHEKLVFNFHDQKSEIKDQIKSVFGSKNIFKYKTVGIFKNYLGMTILLAWFPILYLLIEESYPKDAGLLPIGITIAISLILFRLIKYSIRWHKSEIKNYLILTPLYFIISEFEKITSYYISSLRSINATHNYKGGFYRDTDVTLHFQSGTEYIFFRSKADFQSFESAISFCQNNIAKEIRSNNFHYIIDNDFLENAKPSSKNNQKRILHDLILPNLYPIIFSVIVYFSLVFLIEQLHLNSFQSQSEINKNNIDKNETKTDIYVEKLENRQKLWKILVKENKYKYLYADFDKFNAWITKDEKNLKALYDDLSNSYSDIEEAGYTKFKEYTTGDLYSDKNNFHYDKSNPQMLPATGILGYYLNKERVAPLTIITKSNYSFFVKLEDQWSKKTILTLFIRPNNTLNIDVPLGYYQIKYATGDKWYGEEFLFGPETQYNKANEIFEFTFDGNQYNGYTIELFSQINGNLSTSKITSNEF